LIFKINATFAVMKKGRNIFLNTLILIIVFFWSGIDARSNSEAQRYFIEHSTCSNNFSLSVWQPPKVF
jgi:hypothetical protein